MLTKMPNPLNQKKEILLTLFQGPRRRASAEIRLDRRVQGVFARLEGADGNVPSRGVYKIRAGEQHPARVIARRLVEAKEAGTAPERIADVAREIVRWVEEDLCGSKRAS